MEPIETPVARPRRSALYLPASNPRAVEKARRIPADSLIFDLEDAVAPDSRDRARAELVEAFGGGFGASERVIRINAPGTADFAADCEAVRQCRPDAVLVPKVSSGADLVEAARELADADGPPRLWAMVETPEALMGLAAIVEAGIALDSRLDCLVVGTNDIAKDTGVSTAEGRRYLVPWLMSIVLAARRYGVCVLDGVWNDFRDVDGFAAEAAQGRSMGFDGKTLIHPTQVDAANEVFSPSADAIARARAIVDAFDLPANRGAGVINLEGAMVERLHLAQARQLLEIQAAIDAAR